MRTIVTICAAMLALWGCGGSSEEEHHAEGEHGGEHHAGGEHHGGEHSAGTPELTALHGVIAPIWHSEPGDARGQMTCDQRAELEARTTAVVGSSAPEGADASAWQAATARLQSSWQAITMACDGPDAAATAEARLSSYHDAFHALMERAGAGHH